MGPAQLRQEATRLRQLAQHATPGPWGWYAGAGRHGLACSVFPHTLKSGGAVAYVHPARRTAQANAAHIAHCDPAWALVMAAQLDRLADLLERTDDAERAQRFDVLVDDAEDARRLDAVVAEALAEFHAKKTPEGDHG